MASDYKKICQENIQRRGEEFDDMGRLISEQLYSDRSHFVYELLQNAEDALERRFRNNPEDSPSCKVQFLLFKDRLEFRHFGAMFSEDDVRGISDILRGTKHEDLAQIGTFGIGFKSVYAFTASPEIHSGEEHFAIKRYIRPEAKELSLNFSIKQDETVFIFPFDHQSFSKEAAFDLILDKLRKLGPRVLLFLKRIDEIEWRVEPRQKEGHYLKEVKRVDSDKNAHRVSVVGQNNDTDEHEDWLIFKKPVPDRESGGQTVVEVAFRLQTSSQDYSEGIVRTHPSPLVVYFPTEKETGMGFLIQGPFNTTPARDNISAHDAWNRKLIGKTAELAVESLRQLKEMGLMSVTLLQAMPIRMDDFSETSLFYPIFSEVRRALMNEEFFPAADGTFVAARNAKIAGSERLINLLNSNQLRLLFQTKTDTKWLKPEITERRTPDLWQYLRSELEVIEVDPEMFARRLSKHFLECQTDEWFKDFYEFLSGQESLWRPPRWRWQTGGILRNKPILRLQDGTHVNPFRDDNSPNAYLAERTEIETSLPVVKLDLSEHEKALQFLRALGIPELDLVEEVIEEILPLYRVEGFTVSVQQNQSDLKKIMRAYETDSQDKRRRLQKKLQETPFILAENPYSKERVYRRPHQVYFGRKVLRMYFAGNESFVCVSQEHPQSDLFKSLGVKGSVTVERIMSYSSENYVTICDQHGWHERGLDGFDPSLKVDGLESAIAAPTLERSAFVWNDIARPNSHCIRGTVEKSSRQTYQGSYKEEQLSKFGEILINGAWLPDSKGKMHRPSELALDDLPESFIRDEKLADQLGMRKDVVAKLAEVAGVSEENLYLARRIETSSSQTQRQIDALLRGEMKKSPKASEQESQYSQELSAVFSNPGGSPRHEYIENMREVTDPQRRREKTQEDIIASIENERERGQRFFPTFHRKWEGKNDLVRMSLVEWYGGKCQICRKTFVQRNGESYFEGLYLVSRTIAGWQDRVGNILCLCAQHSAMFQFGPREVEEDIIQQLMRLKVKEEGGDGHLAIQMKLCDELIEITFAEKHLIDLQEMIRATQ